MNGLYKFALFWQILQALSDPILARFWILLNRCKDLLKLERGLRALKNGSTLTTPDNCAGTGADGELGGGGDEEQVHRLQHVQLSHQEEQGALSTRRQVRKVMRTFYF